MGPTYQERHLVAGICAEVCLQSVLKMLGHDMLHCLDLPTLVVRRQHLKLMTMYNIINGKTVFPAGIFNLREHTSQRHFSSLYNRLYARTNYLYFSFVPNVVSLWNALPLDLRLSSTAGHFKFYLSQLAHVLH